MYPVGTNPECSEREETYMEIDLSRFRQAHERDYGRALAEVRNGRKTTHWMWYIFPQVAGLGMSSTSRHYAIGGIDEARAYLEDPVLGGHMQELCAALLELGTDDAIKVFGNIDAVKLRSSMTLFSLAVPDSWGQDPFEEVLVKYFGGERDARTLELLEG